ncbi:MAG: CapA family protein [Bacilli bacterium]
MRARDLLVILFIFVVLGAGTWGVVLSKTFENSRPKVTEKKQPISEKVPLQKPKEEVHTASLLGVGDVLVHRSVYYDAHIDGDSYDFMPMFQNVASSIHAADVSVANSETMIGGVEIGLSDYPTFNSPVEVGEAIAKLGFDVVTLANNHTIDRGEKAVLRGLHNWDKIGIVHTGANSSFEQQQQIRTFMKNEIMFSFLSYTYGTNGIPIPVGKEYLVNIMDKEKMHQDIQRAKSQSDVVVVSMHWGIEYQSLPNEEQKKWAQWLADEGVDVILGSHPHVLQPPAWVVGKNGNKTYVVYSMGNFISAQEGTQKLIGGLFSIDVKKIKKGSDVSIELSNPSVEVVYNYYSNYRNFMLYPLQEIPTSLVRERETLLVETKRLLTHFIPELSVS